MTVDQNRTLVIIRLPLRVLAAEGMLRPGLRPDDLDYTLPTVVFGSFAAEPFLPPSLGLTLEQKADQLADTCAGLSSRPVYRAARP